MIQNSKVVCGKSKENKLLKVKESPVTDLGISNISFREIKNFMFENEP
jgi:hypothetical protein